MSKPKRLGGLLQEYLGTAGAGPSELDGVQPVPLARISPNPFQPRRTIEDTEIQDLAASLSEHGLLQPIVVRPKGDGFEMVAGERRWRAAGLLGWPEIAASVRDLDDRSMLALALVENLQRANLGPIEEAAAYHELLQVFGCSQTELARLVGRDRSTIANALRLLDLPAPIGIMLSRGELSGGHARALLAAKEPRRMVELAEHAVRGEWSVRRLEQAAAAPALHSARKRPSGADPGAARIEECTGLETRIRRRGERGVIELRFESLDQVRVLIARLRA